MKPSAIAVLVILAAATAAGVGYWWGASGRAPAVASSGPPDGPKILYYRNPMVPTDTSPVPKNAPDGMPYVPVYATDADAAAAGAVRISAEKVQALGVRTEPATRRELVRTVRAVGTVEPDERRRYTVAPKFEGWIQTLQVNTTGQTVTRGQSLMEIYSPDLISAQEEYLIAARGLEATRAGDPAAQSGMQQLMDKAVQRLRNWDIADAELRYLEKEQKARQYLPLRSPVTGTVLEKPSVAGQRFMAGDVLYRIADLSTVWLLAEVFEQDLALVHVGQAATIRLDAYPGDTFEGRVAFIYPTVTPETRTAKVRVELANRAGLLKPAMYARAEFASSHSKARALTVPESAVLDTGTRQLVLVQRGEGLFEPRPVKLGMHADGFVEVREGVEAGDQVVVSANFLIDADSNLKTALGTFGGHGQGAENASQPAPAAAGQDMQEPMPAPEAP